MANGSNELSHRVGVWIAASLIYHILLSTLIVRPSTNLNGQHFTTRLGHWTVSNVTEDDLGYKISINVQTN